MESLLLLLDMVAVVLLGHWAFANDKAGRTGPVTGLFSFRDQAGPSRRTRADGGTGDDDPRDVSR